MNRLYAVESTPTIAGATADHRLALRPSLDRAASRAAVARSWASPARSTGRPSRSGEHARWIAAVAADLKAHAGTSLVVAGRGAARRPSTPWPTR